MDRDWIETHLFSSGEPVYRRFSASWFRNNGHTDALGELKQKTSFLGDPSLSQRIWHVFEDSDEVMCGRSGCDNTPTFESFAKGYRSFCSNSCAQRSEDVREKIESTNTERYGAGRPIAADTKVREKAEQTIREKFGVENASKAEEVKREKRETCRKNFGTDWPMQSQEVREKAVQTSRERFGTDNPMQAQTVKKKAAETRKERSAKRLLDSDRLTETVKPLFGKEEYRGIRHGYLFECKQCGNKFFDSLRKGEVPRCRECYPSQRNSRAQREVTEFISGLGFEVRENVGVGGVEVDVYVPSCGFAVEYDGLYWHSEVANGRGKNYHLNKTEACAEKGVELVHVFSDEWRDRKPAVKNRLRHKLGKAEQGPGARECEKRKVATSASDVFLDENHLQGSDSAPHAYGLFHSDELVAVLTTRLAGGFGSSSKADIEISRFCTDGRSVPGAFGRLFSLMLEDLDPDTVVTFCDRRWSPDGGFYESFGFEQIAVTNPGYWYVKNGSRHHRYNFRKSVLSEKLDGFDPELTEWQNMQASGWDRIWDCGNFKYLYNNT